MHADDHCQPDVVRPNIHTFKLCCLRNGILAPSTCGSWRACDLAIPRTLYCTPQAGPGRRGAKDLEVNAAKDPLTLSGKKVYSAYFERVEAYPGGPHPKEVGVGYRINNTTGVAKGDEPETLYMVTSGTHFNEGCCFDYGNAETFIGDAGCGTMEAISITNGTTTMHGAHHGQGGQRSAAHTPAPTAS